ncbi:Cylicin-2, partial [Ophiophagus hannah]
MEGRVEGRQAGRQAGNKEGRVEGRKGRKKEGWKEERRKGRRKEERVEGRRVGRKEEGKGRRKEGWKEEKRKGGRKEEGRVEGRKGRRKKKGRVEGRKGGRKGRRKEGWKEGRRNCRRKKDRMEGRGRRKECWKEEGRVEGRKGGRKEGRKGERKKKGRVEERKDGRKEERVEGRRVGRKKEWVEGRKRGRKEGWKEEGRLEGRKGGRKKEGRVGERKGRRKEEWKEGRKEGRKERRKERKGTQRGNEKKKKGRKDMHWRAICPVRLASSAGESFQGDPFKPAFLYQEISTLHKAAPPSAGEVTSGFIQLAGWGRRRPYPKSKCCNRGEGGNPGCVCVCVLGCHVRLSYGTMLSRSFERSHPNGYPFLVKAESSLVTNEIAKICHLHNGMPSKTLDHKQEHDSVMSRKSKSGKEMRKIRIKINQNTKTARTLKIQGSMNANGHSEDMMESPELHMDRHHHGFSWGTGSILEQTKSKNGGEVVGPRTPQSSSSSSSH